MLNLLSAIVLAVGSGALLAIGTHLQNSAVPSGAGGRGDHRATIIGVLTNRRWITGGLVLVAAIVVQLFSLSLAPISVVQPLGVSALLVAAGIRARIENRRPSKALIRAIALCVAGVTVFVLVTSAFSRDQVPADEDVWWLLVSVVTAAGGTLLVGRLVRGRAGDLVLVLSAGTMFGSVATVAKVLLLQPVLWSSEGTGLALAPNVFAACCVTLVLAAVCGTLLIQIAHRRLPSELVVAGLTVVDPLVAVVLGGAVLGEMETTPLWALIIVTVVAAIAISGVFDLAAWHRGRSILIEAEM